MRRSVFVAAAVTLAVGAAWFAERPVATQGKYPMGQSAQRGELAGYSYGGYGVSGQSDNVGVHASNTSNKNEAYLASRCCAGDFYGTVFVHGVLNVEGRKNFVIDDPIDPDNMYLIHASVESSEMKNLYDGIATLDAHGEAVVQLPAWFGALNKDFRYQLTAIGAPAPGLYIAREIANNRFSIAGGLAGLKVSWLVSGVRQDEWAKSHPMQVEQPKPRAPATAPGTVDRPD
jgi:hypothetical protein